MIQSHLGSQMLYMMHRTSVYWKAHHVAILRAGKLKMQSETWLFGHSIQVICHRVHKGNSTSDFTFFCCVFIIYHSPSRSFSSVLPSSHLAIMSPYCEHESHVQKKRCQMGFSFERLGKLPQQWSCQSDNFFHPCFLAAFTKETGSKMGSLWYPICGNEIFFPLTDSFCLLGR